MESQLANELIDVYKGLNQLVDAYDKYIKLLEDKDKRYEDGIKCRKEIKRVRTELVDKMRKYNYLKD